MSLALLPPEIIHLVTNQICLPDAARVSLCCRGLFVLLGREYYPALEVTQRNKLQPLDFLQIIARGVPTLFFCHSYSHLHPADRVGPPGPALQPSLCHVSRIVYNLISGRILVGSPTTIPTSTIYSWPWSVIISVSNTVFPLPYGRLEASSQLIGRKARYPKKLSLSKTRFV